MTSISDGMRMPSATLIKLCDIDDVDEDEPYRAEIDGLGFAVFRVGNLVFVTADLCSHGPGLLSDGHVEDFQVVCPFHQGTFDIRTGEPTGAPCEIAIRTWSPVILEDGIYIDPLSPA